MGADEAVLVSDRALAGSDTLATSFALAGVVKSLGDVDLVCAANRLLTAIPRRLARKWLNILVFRRQQAH